MKANLSIGLLCGLVVSLAGLPSQPSGQSAAAEDQQAEQPITVQLTGGRTFTAEIDSRTDREQLWLRWKRGPAVLLRAIQWDQVVQARVAGEDLSGEQLRCLVDAIRQADPFREEPAAGQRRIVIRASARGGSAEAASGPVAEAPAAPRVRSLAIEAVAANWDADVEVDGLLVYVYPLDSNGAVVPARGTLQVDLTGQRTGVVRRPQPFTRLGHWARAVRVEDFGLDGAVYRLPFQGVHPEFEPAVAPYGAVHSRLSVPGQGTFEATRSTVRIRPYSAVRNQLQQATGRRFFAQERTGQGRR